MTDHHGLTDKRRVGFDAKTLNDFLWLLFLIRETLVKEPTFGIWLST
jgi:hypothetical protein